MNTEQQPLTLHTLPQHDTKSESVAYVRFKQNIPHTDHKQQIFVHDSLQSGQRVTLHYDKNRKTLNIII